jgi:hypothetical protein
MGRSSRSDFHRLFATKLRGARWELRTSLPDVPIILFTQHANLGEHLLGSNLLADRIVSKSELEELVGHIRSLIPV